MTKLLDLRNESRYSTYINDAIIALKNGRIVGFPTETVYGLGANAIDNSAISLLYHVKQRPKEKKLTILLAYKSDIKHYANKITKEAQKLIDVYWPGPLTLVVPSKKGDLIGLRIPKHKVTFDLVSKCGFPIVAPSANISGKPALTSGKKVFDVFNGKIDIVLDDGDSHIGGVASTVVQADCSGINILREGAIPNQAIYDCIK